MAQNKGETIKLIANLYNVISTVVQNKSETELTW